MLLKKDQTKLGLICQIYDPGYKTRVTPLKINLKKQRSKIFDQTNIEKWNWGENVNKKNNAKQNK
jgi:hypothetical protein